MDNRENNPTGSARRRPILNVDNIGNQADMLDPIWMPQIWNDSKPKRGIKFRRDSRITQENRAKSSSLSFYPHNEEAGGVFGISRQPIALNNSTLSIDNSDSSSDVGGIYISSKPSSGERLNSPKAIFFMPDEIEILSQNSALRTGSIIAESSEFSINDSLPDFTPNIVLSDFLNPINEEDESEKNSCCSLKITQVINYLNRIIYCAQGPEKQENKNISASLEFRLDEGDILV